MIKTKKLFFKIAISVLIILIIILASIICWYNIVTQLASANAKNFCMASQIGTSKENILANIKSLKSPPNRVSNMTYTESTTGYSELMITWRGALVEKSFCNLSFEYGKLVLKKSGMEN